MFTTRLPVARHSLTIPNVHPIKKKVNKHLTTTRGKTVVKKFFFFVIFVNDLRYSAFVIVF